MRISREISLNSLQGGSQLHTQLFDIVQLPQTYSIILQIHCKYFFKFINKKFQFDGIFLKFCLAPETVNIIINGLTLSWFGLCREVG